jgi:hypothetical protein
MFSMTVELAKTISSQDENIKISKYLRTLFPAPAFEGENHQSLRNRRSWRTDAFHESKEAILVRTISIPRTCYLRQTTLPYGCVAIQGQDCDFSMDRVERANFEHLAVACHLPDNLSDSRQQWQLYKNI